MLRALPRSELSSWARAPRRCSLALVASCTRRSSDSATSSQSVSASLGVTAIQHGHNRPTHNVLNAWVDGSLPSPDMGSHLAYPSGYGNANGNSMLAGAGKDADSVMSVAGPPLLKQPDHYSTYSTVVYEESARRSATGGDQETKGEG